jgi:hypothetical protein
MEKREDRRDRTLRVAWRRWRSNEWRLLRDERMGPGMVMPARRPGSGFFRKRTELGCGCSKRRKGRPHLAGGMCKPRPCRHPALVVRRQERADIAERMDG